MTAVGTSRVYQVVVLVCLTIFLVACLVVVVRFYDQVKSEAIEDLGDHIAKAVADRRMEEARARLLDPGLDQTDVALLTDAELAIDPNQPVVVQQQQYSYHLK